MRSETYTEKVDEKSEGKLYTHFIEVVDKYHLQEEGKDSIVVTSQMDDKTKKLFQKVWADVCFDRDFKMKMVFDPEKDIKDIKWECLNYGKEE